MAAQPFPIAVQDFQRQQEQQILQQEERRRGQEQELQRRQDAPPDGQRLEPLPQEPLEQGALCVDIATITVNGSTLLSASQLAALTAPYEKQCLSLAAITNLLRAVTNAYIEKGYVTSRAFVDPSQKQDGNLAVMVVEGKVEAVIINDGDPKYSYLSAVLFPGIKGNVLNLRDIEQGLDQLNRLSSNNGVMELVPGEALGSTKIMVRTQTVKTYRASVGVDNLGQRSTGRYQYALSLEKDNTLGIADQFAVYWTEDAPLLEEALRKGPQQEHNHSLAAYFSQPFGYWTLSANAGRYYNRSTIYAPSADYSSTGDTDFYKIGLDRVVHRNADSKTSLGVSLATRDVENAIAGQRLDVSSYRTTALGLTLSHNRRLWGGVLGGNVEHLYALDIFGSSEEQSRSHNSPSKYYQKTSIALSWYRPFAVWEQRFAWSLSAQGQMSPDTLYSSERIQVGGRGSVRGFADDSLTGDQGAYARNELSWSLPWPENWNKSPVSGLSLYSAYDYGFIRQDERSSHERGRMQGVAFGLRSTGDMSFDCSVGKALDHPSFVKTRDYEVYASIRYTF